LAHLFSSSRRRHTSFSRDWSSDVCSSDLGIRVFSASPIPSGTRLKVKGSPGSTQIRINLTDVNHETLGYTMAQPGTVTVPPQIQIGRASCRESGATPAAGAWSQPP